jgi:hypothetical protein
MADYGILFLSKLFMYRSDVDGAYIVPERHEPGSVTFGIDTYTEWTTVTEYLEAYESMKELKGTGYDTTLFLQFVLMGLCTATRLVDGTGVEDFLNMQCYDNFVADIYLTEAEGVYAMVDLFTWKGIGIAYLYMMLHGGLATIGETMVSYSLIYLFYLINIGSLTYGDVDLMTPVWDWGWFGPSFSITL